MMPITEMMILKPAEELGPVLTSRGRAAALREAVEQQVASGAEVVIDLVGVETLSPSFADELFAKLDKDLIDEARVQFENVPESIEPLLRFVVHNRRQTA